MDEIVIETHLLFVMLKTLADDHPQSRVSQRPAMSVVKVLATSSP
jgi:hypothetical protein